MRQPVRCARSGLWLARITTPDGRVRQVGRFERKRDAQRAIALELVDALPPCHDELLFRTVRRKVMSQRNFYRSTWEPARQASGARFSLYDARHTFSSRLLSAGIPLVMPSRLGPMRRGGPPVGNAGGALSGY